MRRPVVLARPFGVPVLAGLCLAGLCLAGLCLAGLCLAASSAPALADNASGARVSPTPAPATTPTRASDKGAGPASAYSGSVDQAPSPKEKPRRLTGVGEAAAREDPPTFDMFTYFKFVGVIFLMLAALAAAFYLLKRYGPKAGLGALTRSDLVLEGQLALGPKRQIVVVRFLNKRLVLGVTDANINLLTETEADHDDHDDDIPKRPRTGFAESLERFARKAGERTGGRGGPTPE